MKCNHCKSENTIQKFFQTFNYWYCKDCKKEIESNIKSEEVYLEVNGNKFEGFQTSTFSMTSLDLPKKISNLEDLYEFFNNIFSQKPQGLTSSHCNLSSFLEFELNYKVGVKNDPIEYFKNELQKRVDPTCCSFDPATVRAYVTYGSGFSSELDIYFKIIFF